MNSENISPGRLLGLDVGAKRIGLAISDALGITAQGLPTLHRRNKRTDFAELQRIIAEYSVSELVIGYPLRLSGRESAQTGHVKAFADELQRKFGLPVHLWDERLTSAEANRLLRETDMSIRRRGQVVDQMAAVLILQSFMENRKHSF
jgi:putative Holliday junction resolvase